MELRGCNFESDDGKDTNEDILKNQDVSKSIIHQNQHQKVSMIYHSFRHSG